MTKIIMLLRIKFLNYIKITKYLVEKFYFEYQILNLKHIKELIKSMNNLVFNYQVFW